MLIYYFLIALIPFYSVEYVYYDANSSRITLVRLRSCTGILDKGRYSREFQKLHARKPQRIRSLRHVAERKGSVHALLHIATRPRFITICNTRASDITPRGT